jgi:phosphoserine phosphatase RsbU/P
MNGLRAKLREFWRGITRTDLVMVGVFAGGIVAELTERQGGLFSFLKFLAVIAAAYLFVRVFSWWRKRLLWSLRNRLIVAGLFLALVPVFLLLTLGILSGLILYTQLGGYLLYQDFQQRVQMLSDGGDHIAAAVRSIKPGVSEEVAERAIAAQEHAVYDRNLPGLVIEFDDSPALLQKVATPPSQQFAGLIQQGNRLFACGLQAVEAPKGLRVVTLRVPLTPEFISTLAPDLGPIEFDLLELAGGPQNAVTYTLANTQYRTSNTIPAKRRYLQPAKAWWDLVASGVAKFEAVLVKEDGTVERARPVIAFFKARPSRLNDRMFASVGELGRVYIFGFAVASTLFLLLELGALTTGLVLTRRITKAVSDLYQATQHVKTGDWSHRVPIERRDQLGILGESFNDMTSSISNLLQEYEKRQRLENEISIAKEVQNQLFPQELPVIPGVELEAICKAARTVSGDYYDFIQLSPTHVAIAIADISGKGISAALLMASLQAALRSQLLADHSESLSTAKLVSRLNLHLVRNTGDDRFATFFIAVYDSATRRLRYTNAGHLPGFLISNGASRRLEEGGMVLGVVEDYEYEEGSVIVPPNAMFVQYSDGLVEPENAYLGEEFGIKRLEEAAKTLEGAAPLMVGESLMAAVEEWAGSPEQADDMTVVVARLR